MKKLIIIAIITVLLTLTTANNTNAVATYVGIYINNLTDDSANSCAGVSGYGQQGRIRAIAAILPAYPIYFNLSKVSDGSTVWAGDGTDDTDYTIGDTIYLPTSVDLTIAENYNLFFDIDALRIYLPLTTLGTFIASPDDNYYTIGSTAGTENSGFYSSSSGCAYAGTYSGGSTYSAVFSDRTLTISRRIMMTTATDFKIDNKYNGLSNTNSGNFNLPFTYS
jgi:hypothetical protein